MHFQIGDLILVSNNHRIALITRIQNKQLFLLWQDTLKTIPFSISVANRLIEKGKWIVSKNS
jgi:hypothetical protein